MSARLRALPDGERTTRAALPRHCGGRRRGSSREALDMMETIPFRTAQRTLRVPTDKADVFAEQLERADVTEIARRIRSRPPHGVTLNPWKEQTLAVLEKWLEITNVDVVGDELVNLRYALMADLAA